MIKEIVIKNVATYDDKGVTIDNIEKINYIYGANGCGKTTISNLLGNFELEKYSDCQVKWANNVAERVFVYNKTFREKNFKESDIAGIFTLGQATTEEIQEINKKKADLEDLKRNIIANKNTIESLNSKIQKEEADFKEIIWKDVYKANEDKFKAAFVGFMKKDTFASKVKGIELSRNENVDRDEI